MAKKPGLDMSTKTLNHEYKFLGRLGFQPIIYGLRGDFSPFSPVSLSLEQEERTIERIQPINPQAQLMAVILYTHHSSVLISFSEVLEIVISLHIMTYALRICAEKIEKATGWG